MRESVKVREDIIKDKNLTPNEFRIYSYLLFLEEDDVVDIKELSENFNMTTKEIIKSITRLAELGYTVDIEYLNQIR